MHCERCNTLVVTNEILAHLELEGAKKEKGK